MRKIVISFFCIIACISCSLAHNMNPYYKNKTYKDKTLAIADFDIKLNIDDFQKSKKFISTLANELGSWEGGGIEVRETFRTNFKYLIWDNNEKQVVLFDEISCDSVTYLEPNDNYLQMISLFSREIIKNTPFDQFQGMNF